MNHTPTCHYVTLPTGRQVHYRKTGAGPPLILLHPSPQDAQAVVAAMQRFAEVCSCIAPDTPGYGLSDDLAAFLPSLDDYADAIIALADALAIDRFAIYGVATGAQIAVALGKRYPGRAALVMLDSNGHLDRSEQAAMLQGYFPDVTPRRDGSHLLTWWDMCSSVFAAFPWHSDKAASHLPLAGMPAGVVHGLLRRYLDAGQNYAKAYRLALEAEHIDHLRGLDVPATMMRWEGSIVLPMADAMIAQGLPDNVRVLYADAPIAQRYAVQCEALRSHAAIAGLPDWHGPRHAPVRSPGRGYWAGLHGYGDLERAGVPQVFLHAAGQSHCRWSDLVALTERPVIALDLPGHGHSPDCAGTSLSAMIDAVGDALDTAGVQAARLVGEGLGGVIAIALSARSEGREALVVNPVRVPRDAKTRWCDALPDFTPRDSGAHLVEAWHYVRQNALRHPWFDGSPEARLPIDLAPAAVLHEKVADIVRCADPSAMMRREIEIDWDDALQRSDGRVTVHEGPDDRLA